MMNVNDQFFSKFKLVGEVGGYRLYKIAQLSEHVWARRRRAAVNAEADEPQTAQRCLDTCLAHRERLSILVVAAFLRFYDLDLVPLHHDEGVNGNFLVRLVREGFYQYDPANYHGPTLYYFAAFFPRILQDLFGVQRKQLRPHHHCDPICARVIWLGDGCAYFYVCDEIWEPLRH